MVLVSSIELGRKSDTLVGPASRAARECWHTLVPQELRERCVVVLREMARDEAGPGVASSATVDVWDQDLGVRAQRRSAGPMLGHGAEGPLDGRTLVTLLRALALTGALQESPPR